MLYFEEAWRVLFANKIRSLLTMTGLIIGTAAVIAIQVLGASMAGAVNGALGSLTDNSFVIFPDARQRDVKNAAISLSDISAVASSVPGIIDSTPLGGTSELVRAGHNVGRFVLSPDSVDSLVNLPLQYGRKFTADDIANASNVTVISHAAYQRLYPDGGDPTGTSVYAGSHRYVVVGVLVAPKRGFINVQFDGDMLVPWTTYAHDFINGSTVFGAGFVVSDASRLSEIEVATIAKLRELHGNAAGISYQTGDKAQLTQGINGIFTSLTVIVGLIGLVSLVVAGIGIMNIMLVSVAERTREIGIRKAIGARRQQILWQFFLEALMLCGSGCLIGLGIGLALGAYVNTFYIVKLTGTVTPIPWLEASLIAVGFAAFVTLAFGTYPALRAASLNPIEALRYE
jgi:ABC-type antimicrobial peptide transport system permease subunit